MNIRFTCVIQLLLVTQFCNAQTKTEKSPEIFTLAEVNPIYTQGYDGWIQYLSKNLNNELPFKNGAPETTYRVSLQFIVETDGSISEIKALNNPGYGMEEEAIRVLKESGKWRPASQNKFIVRCYKKETIVFAPSSVYKTYLQQYPEASRQIDTANFPLPGIFNQPDLPPIFSKDHRAWLKYLQKELKGDLPYDNGAPKGYYVTTIQFVVDEDGTLSDIRPVSFIGYGMDEEAARVVKESGKWKAAEINGKKVKAYRILLISFYLQ